MSRIKNLGKALIDACNACHRDGDFVIPIPKIVCGRVNKNGDMFLYDVKAVNTYMRENNSNEKMETFEDVLAALEKTAKKHSIIKK